MDINNYIYKKWVKKEKNFYVNNIINILKNKWANKKYVSNFIGFYLI